MPIQKSARVLYFRITSIFIFFFVLKLTQRELDAGQSSFTPLIRIVCSRNNFWVVRGGVVTHRRGGRKFVINYREIREIWNERLSAEIQPGAATEVTAEGGAAAYCRRRSSSCLAISPYPVLSEFVRL